MAGTEIAHILSQMQSAIRNHDASLVTSLLEVPLDSGRSIINISSTDGRTPLMIGAMFGNRDIVELLVGAGADLNCTDYMHRSPLIHALMGGQSKETISMLIDAGAQVGHVSYRTIKLPLACALEFNLSCVDVLIQKGADLNFFNAYNDAPLSVALKQNVGLDVVSKLINAGADVNAVYEDSKRPIMLAAIFGNHAVIKRLIESGAEVNCEDKTHRTPLVYAMRTRDCKETIKLLVEAGADVNDYRARYTPPLACAIGFSPSCIGFLIDKGADVNYEDSTHKTPLLHALHAGRCIDIVKLLIESGAEVNDSRAHLQSPISCALESPNLTSIDFLIQKGATVKSVDLITAVKSHDSTDIVEKLIKVGAKVDVIGPDDIAVVTWTLTMGKWKLFHLLMSQGAALHQEHLPYIFKAPFDVVVVMLKTGKMMPAFYDASVLYYSDKCVPFYPQTPIFTRTKASPFMIALLAENANLAKAFLSVQFFLTYDTHLHRALRRAVIKELGKRLQGVKTGTLPEARLGPIKECMSLAKTVYCKPMPLYTLCFVKVSTHLGFDPGRKEKVSKTELPAYLKRQLMFGTTC